VIVSMGVTKRPLGFLINERNLMSLSRFQTVLWMVIILSSYFVIAVSKVVMGLPDPLEIGVDEKLWALMGISLTSLVGTSLINSTKTNKNPDNREVEKTAKALVESNNLPVSVARADQPEKVAMVVKEIKANREGTLYANPSTADASFNDMFQGDECGNAAYIDMAKVQMFFFTIVVALSYVALLSETMWRLATDPVHCSSLPNLSNGMIALLGISYAGNLAGKSVDRTKLQ
jgi:hypothetical protein